MTGRASNAKGVTAQCTAQIREAIEPAFESLSPRVLIILLTLWTQSREFQGMIIHDKLRLLFNQFCDFF